MLLIGNFYFIFRCLTQEQLQNECGITNSIHRLRILDAIKGGKISGNILSFLAIKLKSGIIKKLLFSNTAKSCLTNSFQQDSEKPLDVFISYRRSNGSQLAR